MSQRERHILERGIRTVSEQAAKVDAVVDAAFAAGLDGSHPLTVWVRPGRLFIWEDVEASVRWALQGV